MSKSKEPDKPSKSPLILLIDDDTFLIRIYQTKLELEGYKVLTAQDGEKGLAIIRKHKPDLILLDAVLPKINGFDLIKKIKRNKILSQIPVIFLTNLSSQQDIKKALDLGVSDYLIKAQAMPDEVIQKINKTLEK